MTEPTPIQRLLPVFIGVAITIVFLIGLAVLAERRRAAPSPELAPITVVDPAPDAVVDSPLVLRFTTPAPVRLTANGWGTDRLHLHARVSNVEHMPAAADIVAHADTYAWTLPAVPRGRHFVKVGWADLHHRELTQGVSDLFEVTVR